MTFREMLAEGAVTVVSDEMSNDDIILLLVKNGYSQERIAALFGNDKATLRKISAIAAKEMPKKNADIIGAQALLKRLVRGNDPIMKKISKSF